MDIIPRDWLSLASMKRIICHWSAGSYSASNNDRMHYHILIEGSGKLVRGIHSIDDNVSTSDGDYAAHTLGTNTGSIGIAVCCMAEATERPFDPGPCPMTELQWDTMVQVAAELSRFYNIPVTPQTILGHGEVEANLGRKQKGKWDPMILPWAPHMTRTEVGFLLRKSVEQALQGADMEETTAKVNIVIDGKTMDGVSTNGIVYVRLSDLIALSAFEFIDFDSDFVVVKKNGKLLYLRHDFLEAHRLDAVLDRGLFEAKLKTDGLIASDELARALDARDIFDEATNALNIATIQPTTTTGPSGTERRIVVQAGDTLSSIAATHLGDRNLWRSLRKTDGTPFSEAEARQLAVGTVVIAASAVSSQMATSFAGAGPAPNSPVSLDELSIAELVEVVPAGLKPFARESIPIILSECAKQGIVNNAHIAYVLATSQHESAAGKFMREIWGPTAAQKRYENRSDLGNNQPGDGFRFRGRGYVQITGRANYTDWTRRLNIPGVDLERTPEIIEQQPSIAAAILVGGMRDGTFRNRKLSTFLDGDEPDFYGARDIINGDKQIIDKGETLDRGTRIANIARRYLSALS